MTDMSLSKCMTLVNQLAAQHHPFATSLERDFQAVFSSNTHRLFAGADGGWPAHKKTHIDHLFMYLSQALCDPTMSNPTAWLQVAACIDNLLQTLNPGTIKPAAGAKTEKEIATMLEDLAAKGEK